MSELLLLELKCFGLASLAVLLNTVVKMNGVRGKAIDNNVEWSYKKHFYREVWAIVANVISMFMTLFFIKDVQNEIGKEWATLLLVATSSYIGSEFNIRVFGASNKFINAAIKYKARIADETTNNTEKPTPAQ